MLSIGKDGLPELRTAGEVHREMLYLQSHPTCFAGGGDNPASGSSPGLAVRIRMLLLLLLLICSVTLGSHIILHALVSLTIKSRFCLTWTLQSSTWSMSESAWRPPMHDAVQIKRTSLFQTILGFKIRICICVWMTISNVLLGDNS